MTAAPHARTGSAKRATKTSYTAITEHSPNADVLIPPRSGAVVSDKSAIQRNRNIVEIETNGRMEWQKARQYGSTKLLGTWRSALSKNLWGYDACPGPFSSTARSHDR